MKICKYIALILSVVSSFPGFATESGEAGNQKIDTARPLKITVTNDELDEDLCYFSYQNQIGKKEISMPLENNNEVVFELRREKSIPFGITVCGGFTTYGAANTEPQRVSAFFPKKGNSVEMIYYGLRDEDFAIELFHMKEPWGAYQPIFQNHCSIMEKSFQALPNILSSTSRLTALKAHIAIEEEPYVGLVFNGEHCPSVSQYPIRIMANGQCRNFKKSGEELQNLSAINISLRKCPTRTLKAEVVSTKTYGQENETMVQQQ